MTVECMVREQAGSATRINLQRFQALYPDGQHLVRGWFAKAMTATKYDGEYFGSFIFAWFAVNGWAACVTRQGRDANYIRTLRHPPGSLALLRPSHLKRSTKLNCTDHLAHRTRPTSSRF